MAGLYVLVYNRNNLYFREPPVFGGTLSVPLKISQLGLLKGQCPLCADHGLALGCDIRYFIMNNKILIN